MASKSSSTLAFQKRLNESCACSGNGEIGEAFSVLRTAGLAVQGLVAIAPEVDPLAVADPNGPTISDSPMTFVPQARVARPRPRIDDAQTLLLSVGGQGTVVCGIGADGSLTPQGRVVVGDEDGEGPGWLIGASCGRLYRVQDPSAAPVMGSNGGDVSLNGRWALAYSYGTGEAAVLRLGWEGVADGDVTGWVEGTLRTHTERCEYDPALADRQDQSHLHQARLHPISQRWAFFPDLGCDKIWIYQFDPVLGTLADEPSSLDLPHGAGPRHMDFSPSGAFVYITCELDGNVAVASFDDASGAMEIVQIISALPVGSEPDRGPNMGNAHIRCDLDGRNVYTTTRSDNGITTFAVSEGGAKLSYVQHVPSGGGCPVHFGLDPNRRWLWCANSKSSNVVTFEVSPTDGSLTQRATLELPASAGYVASPPKRLALGALLPTKL